MIAFISHVYGMYFCKILAFKTPKAEKQLSA